MGLYQPQQSVLYPQDGHRQTACIRNISARQRSQRNRSSCGGAGGDPVGAAVIFVAATAGCSGGVFVDGVISARS
jgi:hypothetical protein